MGLEEDIATLVTDLLKRESSKSLSLASLGSFKSNLSKSKKKLLNRMGMRQFILKFPDKFALIDEVVHLVESDILQAIPSMEDNSNHTPCKSELPSKPKEPSDTAIDNIIRDISKSRSCMVCSDDVELFAYGICFHPICYRCSTKLRVLCSDKQCPACRAELSEVWFTASLKPPSRLDSSSFIKEQKHGISFENKEVYDKHKQLLEHKCRLCSTKFADFDNLKSHMKKKHGEYFCDICLRHCKIFTDERKTYTTQALREHEEAGDNGEGSAHKGHPLCQYCNTRYLDRDELYRHLRMNHITCPVCPSDDNAFYANPQSLWNEHISHAHYFCDEPECAYNVQCAFRDPLDLQVHKARVHPNIQSKAMRKQEQRITTGFSAPQRVSVRRQTSTGERVLQDGSIIVYGTVLGQHLRSYYGFVKPDGKESFYENIFFNQQVCEELDDEDALDEHFRHGDRVEVHAKRATNSSSKSSWRALSVKKVKASAEVYSSNRQRTVSENSVDSSASLQKNDFPSLTTSSSSPVVPFASAWNSAGTQRKSYKSSALASGSSSRVSTKPPAQRNVSPRGELPDGSGNVLDNLHKDYGFIVQANSRRQDNIYFNRQAYIEGTGKVVSDLTKELSGNTKVYFTLDHSPPKYNSSSKFRALKVWKDADAPTPQSLASSSTAVETLTPSTSYSFEPPPLEGIGYIHHKLSGNFGFIVWSADRPDEDNIYFNRKSYCREGFDVEVESLIEDLKPGIQVKFVLMSQAPSLSSSSKYRAEKVWKYYPAKNLSPPTVRRSDHAQTARALSFITAESISSTSRPGSDANSESSRHRANFNPKQSQVGAERRQSVESLTSQQSDKVNGKPEKNDQFEQLLNKFNWTGLNNTPGWTAVNSGQTPSTSTGTPDPVETTTPDAYSSVYDGVTDLLSQTNPAFMPSAVELHSTFPNDNSSADELYQSSDEDFPSTSEDEVISMTRSGGDSEPYIRPQNDNVDRFRGILVDILGEAKMDQFTTELAEAFAKREMHVSFNHILCIKFSKQTTTKAFLLPPSTPHETSAVNLLRGNAVEFSFSGFDGNRVGGLMIRGAVTSVTQDFMLVNDSSHYIMLHRNSKGAVKSLTLHYRS